MLLLYLLSAQHSVGTIPGNYDKLLHAVAYAGLGLLTMRAFHGGIERIAWLPTVGALLLTGLYAALDEWHQSHVPGRDASPLDWAADLVGALVCIPLFMILYRVLGDLSAVARDE